MGKPAVTILEMIIVIIIIGVVAALTLPNYSQSMERNRAKSAANNLQVIYNAQKRYRLSNGVYYTCSPCNLTGANGINQELDLSIIDRYFTYDIQADDSSGFKAIATRNADGECAGKTMKITHKNSTIEKGCVIW